MQIFHAVYVLVLHLCNHILCYSGQNVFIYSVSSFPERIKLSNQKHVNSVSLFTRHLKALTEAQTKTNSDWWIMKAFRSFDSFRSIIKGLSIE